MRARGLGSIAVVSTFGLLMLAGCSDTPTVPGDARPSGDTGGGPDSGPGPGFPDTGPPRPDGSVDSSTTDGMTTYMCDPPTAFTFTPPCPAAVKSCLASCDPNNSSCSTGCFRMITDETLRAMCFVCVSFQQTTWCPYTMGCEAETLQRWCCTAATCPPGSSEECSLTLCRTQNEAELRCAQMRAPQCLGVVVSDISNVCFQGG